ncbi:MAG: ankyrin repeat domain-containing protein [Chloracidobacterium sp.]|nr:ankyrin repeat domain-containing protein [Chloracidobacterium sp.]
MTSDAWTETLRDLDEGNFTSLQELLGGPDGFDRQIVDWHDEGRFEQVPDLLAEALSCACMLGRTETAEYLLDNGVDPYAGMKTGLSGPHYSVSGGHFETVRMLLDRNIPLEVENMYGGTLFGQAMWSALHEHSPGHPAIVKALIEAGAVVDPGYNKWWKEQNVPDPDTKRKIGDMLQHLAGLEEKIEAARTEVANAEASDSKAALAASLKALGGLLRRLPFMRTGSNDAYERAASLYCELGLPLDEAWVKRHIGINHEYAGRLEDAERMYDEALALYRQHATDETLDYANAVRYPAVVKNRLGKRDESAKLWEEAHDRYVKIGPGGLGEGVAEAAAWLTIFALDKNDLELARKWFEQARKASSASDDPETHKFIAEVEARFRQATGD